MCVVCDFSARDNAQTHRPGPFNAFWPEAEVSGGSTIAASLGESRLDATDDLSTNYTINQGDTFEGFLGAGDVDVIRLDITSTGNFEPFEIGVQGFGEGTLNDPYLELLDDTGAVIASNDNFTDDTLSAALLHDSFSTNTFYLRVGSSDGGVGGYQVTVLEDPGDSWISAQTLGIYERSVGFLSPGDVDYYEVEDYFLGTPWSVSAFGVGDEGLQDVSIKVFEGFREIASNAETGIPVVTFTPGRTTNYRFEISGGTEDSAGVYEIISSPNPLGSTGSFWFIEPGFFYNLTLEAGDSDWQFVDLIAGREYSFEMYGIENDALDPHIAIFDENGILIDENDDESDDSANAFLRYTPLTDQTVYIETRDATQTEYGLYGMAVQDMTTSTPINAITWQNAVWSTDEAIKVWFAPAGSVVNDTGVIVASDGFTFDQRTEFMALLDQVSQFANISFTQVGSKANADVQVAVGDLDGLFSTSLLGRANPQGSTFYSDGTVVLDDDHWNDAALARGGFMNHVVAHEFGHMLGLAHPHDYGGGSQPMLGVRDDDDLGDFNLNQVPFTAMTYNDYWETLPEPAPSDLGAGFLWGFGALDVAALQAVYGANTATRTDDDRYELGVNDWLETIWDAGGSDEIVYAGRRNVTIDLRTATNGYDALGGGAPSFVQDGLSAFVIASGAVIENGTGGLGWDTLTGNAADNRLEGRNGFDTITGQDGDDLIIGGRGADTLHGDAGDDTIRGERGDDVIFGGSGDDTLFGDNGFDTLDGGAGRDTIRGGQGNDTLRAGADDDTAFGGAGDDAIEGAAGEDTLHGELGDDRIVGGLGNDTITGGDGIDQIIGGPGDDILSGDAGDDRLFGDAGNDTLNGGDGADELNGGAGHDTLNGDAGNDVIYGNDGNDIVYGSAGLDDLSGGTGNDTLYGDDAADVLNGDAGADMLFGGLGDDRLDGGAGNDTLSGGGGGDDLKGGDGHDDLRGEGGDDVLFGQLGDDTLRGDAGADALNGDAGVDTLFGGLGDDVLNGGDGNDDLLGGGDNDTLNGGAGEDTLSGNDGNDSLFGQTDHDSLFGNAGDDRLFGNIGNDDLSGGAGNDVLRGGDGNDRLVGGSGNDALFGEDGFDELRGGAGDDFLNGGRGGGVKDGFADVFIFGQSADGFGGFDRIRDFEDSLDLLDLSGFNFSDFTTDVLALAEDRNDGADLALVMEPGYIIYIDNFTRAEFDASDILI